MPVGTEVERCVRPKMVLLGNDAAYYVYYVYYDFMMMNPYWCGKVCGKVHQLTYMYSDMFAC